MEGTEGGSGGGPQTGAPGPGGVEIQGEHESQRDEQERGRAAERSREGSEVQGRGVQPEGQAKGGRCRAQRGARAEGSSHLARGAPGQDVRAEGQGEARQAGSGLEARGEGGASGQGVGAANSEAQGAPPEGVRQDAEGQTSGPVAKGWVVAELGAGRWEGCVEQRAAETAVEAEAGERRESKSGEEEVPVGSEAPSGVEANQVVGGGGSREAQDQRGTGAGSVTERPSLAQPNLTRGPHKSLTGSLGSHEPDSNLGSPSDRVSQAGVDREPQSLPSGGAPVPYPTSEQLQVPQHDPGEFVLVGTEGVMTAAEMPCGSQGPGPNGARTCEGPGAAQHPSFSACH